jgi:hypothetical protein
MSVDMSDPVDLAKGPVSIGLDSSVHAVAFVVGIGLTGAFVFAFLSDSYSAGLRVMSFTCAVLLLILILVVTPRYVRLYVKKLPALTLSSEGFINYMLSPTLVPWTDVINCSVKNIGTDQNPTKFLVIELRPGALERLAMPRFLRMAHFQNTLLIGSLSCPLDQLATVFEAYARPPR